MTRSWPFALLFWPLAFVGVCSSFLALAFSSAVYEKSVIFLIFCPLVLQGLWPSCDLHRSLILQGMGSLRNFGLDVLFFHFLSQEPILASSFFSWPQFNISCNFTLCPLHSISSTWWCWTNSKCLPGPWFSCNIMKISIWRTFPEEESKQDSEILSYFSF